MFDTHILDEALAKQRRALATEQAELLDRVRHALEDVRNQLGIEAAYVVGSLRSADTWRRSSDIDVAVSGCTPYVLEVMKAVETATGRDVDVIDLDRHPSAAAFARSGLKLYG